MAARNTATRSTGTLCQNGRTGGLETGVTRTARRDGAYTMREMGRCVSDRRVMVKKGAGLGAARSRRELLQLVKPSTSSGDVSVRQPDAPQTLASFAPLAAATPVAMRAAPTAQINARFATQAGM